MTTIADLYKIILILINIIANSVDANSAESIQEIREMLADITHEVENYRPSWDWNDRNYRDYIQSIIDKSRKESPFIPLNFEQTK